MEFVSNIERIAHPVGTVYNVLSDLSRLPAKEMDTEQGHVAVTPVDRDSCTIQASVVQVTLRITERQENKSVKLEAESSPIPATLWIQLLPDKEAEGVCHLRLTVRSDANPFMAGMIRKPLEKGVGKLAQMLASLPYDRISNLPTD